MRHARGWNGNDYTLCGLAEEAGEDPALGGDESHVEYASVGQVVDCRQCMQVIAYCQDRFTYIGRVRIDFKETRKPR